MKKYIYGAVVLGLIVGSFWAGSWYSAGKSPKENTSGKRVLYYVDPMNPAHTSDRPGNAPCGMAMEPVYADAATSDNPDRKNLSTLPPGTVSIPPEKQQIIGVRMGQVQKSPWTYNLRTLGRVAVDETHFFRLVAATDGWTKKLFPNSTGSLIKKNQALITFYSKEFLTAQQSYFYALKTMDRLKQTPSESNEQLALTSEQIRSAEESLQTMGMDDIQIREIASTRKSTRDIILRAPITGFVLSRNVFLGQRFERGTELFRLVDSSRIWILADIYENEAPNIRPGSVARVSVPYSKHVFHAKVSDTLPLFDATSRTLKVRLEMDNPGYALRPDMFVDVEFPIRLPAAITVPVEAVLDTGLKKTIFIVQGNGFFEPRQVETGSSHEGRIEITKGLMAGERIVLSGNFLIDSESRMKMAAASMQAAARMQPAEQVIKDPVCGMDVNERSAKAAGRISQYHGMTYYFCSDACKHRFEQTPENYQMQPGQKQGMIQPAAAATDMDGIFQKDPVCGMDVEARSAKTAGRTSSYRGKTYYFCCNACKQQFDKDPENFVLNPKEGQRLNHLAAADMPDD